MADPTERTEEPTPRRRRDARLDGQLAISQEAFAFANLFAVSLALLYFGGDLFERALAMFRDLWRPVPDMNAAVATELLRRAFSAGAAALWPVLAASSASVIAIGLLQTRGNVARKRLSPKWSKLNPATALGRLIKKQGPVELLKSLVKLGIVGGVLAWVIAGHLPAMQGLSQTSVSQGAALQLQIVLQVFVIGCAALFVLAALDYAYQYAQTEKALRMTRQEVQDEHRQQQGDPQVKARLRSIQYERARTRMMGEVPKADVVVTNPEHVSVALRYERETMHAPRVVAKGAGVLAFRIREIAREHGVPCLPNPPLARALYRGARVGDTIPEALFQAVAELLAFVVRLDPSRPRAW